MVLVSEKPSNNVSFLQTRLSHREGHKARRGGLATMPLGQHMAGRHGERQACLTIGPAPMPHLLEMTHEREHREYCLYQHPVFPRAARTPFEVAGIPRR